MVGCVESSALALPGVARASVRRDGFPVESCVLAFRVASWKIETSDWRLEKRDSHPFIVRFSSPGSLLANAIAN